MPLRVAQLRWHEAALPDNSPGTQLRPVTVGWTPAPRTSDGLVSAVADVPVMSGRHTEVRAPSDGVPSATLVVEYDVWPRGGM